MLLDAGADINAKDKDGKTALYFAKTSKNTEILKLLEEYSKK
jgi:ankyrin repeat protein